MKEFFTISDKDTYIAIDFLENELTIHNSNQFYHKLKSEILDVNKKNLIFDLKNIRYADSSFLAKLILVNKEIKLLKKYFVLINVQDDFYDIMKLAQLDKMLTVRADIFSAVKYFETGK